MKYPPELNSHGRRVLLYAIIFLLSAQDICFGGNLEGKLVFSTQHELEIISLEQEYRWKTPSTIHLPHKGDMAFHPAWLPDGAKVIFEYSPWTDDINNLKQYFAIIDIRNTAINRLQDHFFKKNEEGNHSYPKWSPNGKGLAFLDHERTSHVRNEKGAIIGTKYLNRLLFFDKKTEKVMSLGKVYADLSPLAWSTDSKKIIYGSAEGEIVVFDLDNSSSQILCKGRNPVINPANGHIYYITPENHLFAISIDGKSSLKIDDADWRWSQLVDISKDGNNLFFTDGGSFLMWEYKTIQMINLLSHKKRTISKKYAIIHGASLFR